MLDSLSEFSTVEAIGVLSSVGSIFAPDNPLQYDQAESKPISLQGANVLAEIRKRLSLKPNDYSNEAKDKILFFISDQLSQLALRGADESEIKARLADKHILRPDLYDISIDAQGDELTGRGIRNKHIHDAINYADKTEHVPWSHTSLDRHEEVSFYLHHIQTEDAARQFSLLVVASRKGHALTVVDALRIYPSQVSIADVSEPIDLLKRFVEKYGATTKAGTLESKFIFLSEIAKSKLIGVSQPLIAWQSNDDSRFRAMSLMKSHLDTYEVVLAYSINETAYRKDLKKLGVQVNLV